MHDLTYVQAQFIAYCFVKQKEAENGVDSRTNQRVDVQDYLRRQRLARKFGKEVEAGQHDDLFKPKRKIKS